MLGDKLREQVSDAYVSYFVIAASPAMLNQRSDDLKKFLAVLVEADQILKKDTAAAQAAMVKAAEGALTAETVKNTWSEYVYGIGLDEGLLDTMYSEAKWIESKNIIKGTKADKAKLRKYITDQPLRSVAPKHVQLPAKP